MKPYPKYKDSGIEWIGKIPEHWEIKKLKYSLKPGNDGIKIGPFGSSLKLQDLVEDGYKVYGQENVIKNDFKIGKRFLTNKKFKEMTVYEILPGDLIITMMGTTGRAKVVSLNINRGIMDSHLIRLRFKKEISTDLVVILINNSDYIFNQVKSMSKGSIMGSYAILLDKIFKYCINKG